MRAVIATQGVVSFVLVVWVAGLMFDNQHLEANVDSLHRQLSELRGDGELPELAPYMSDIQLYAHKLGLAIEGENPELANFYCHELEAMFEDVIAEVPTYGGHDIAAKSTEIILPLVEDLEDWVHQGDWEIARLRYESVINGCNSCHETTDHAFIEITVPDYDTPYGQSFASRR